MKLGKNQLNALLFFYRATIHSFKHSDKPTLNALQSLMTKGFITFVTDKDGNLTDQAIITDKGKEVAKGWLADTLFIGCLGGQGYSYANKRVEQHGDYKKLAYLSFATLELYVRPDCPDHLLPFITEHAASLQARKGEEEQITTSGQTVTLGYKMK